MFRNRRVLEILLFNIYLLFSIYSIFVDNVYTIYGNDYIITSCIYVLKRKVKEQNPSSTYLVVLFLLLKFLSLVTLSSSDYTDNDHSNGDFHLKKTVYNSTRVLIVAGLEGTGHHAISAMMEICRKRRPELCEADKELSDKLMLWERSRLAVHGLFGAFDTSISLQLSIDIRSYLQSLANNHTGNHLIYVGLGVTEENGMFSYPSFTGKFKSLDHPDVYQLAIIPVSISESSCCRYYHYHYHCHCLTYKRYGKQYSTLYFF